MIDFHSHILPNIDDGSSSVEEALEMLFELKRQGVDCVVATPHFTGGMSVEEFLKNRDYSYNKLMSAIKEAGESFPKIFLGAEVAVNERLMEKSGIERLCIGGTDCIMTELPVKAWDQLYYQILYTITAKYRLKLIIAHIDRYFSLFGNNQKVIKLAEMQPVFQINTSELNSFRCKKLLRLMRGLDAKVVFGSDCHNMSVRKPFCGEPLQRVEKWFGTEYLNEIDCFGKQLLNNKSE